MKFCQFPLLTSTPPLSALPAMYSLLAFLQDNRLESPLSSPQVIHGVQQLHAAIVTIPTWSIELGIEPWWQDVPERVPPPRVSSASWWSNNLPYSPSATYHPVDFFFFYHVSIFVSCGSQSNCFMEILLFGLLNVSIWLFLTWTI